LHPSTAGKMLIATSLSVASALLLSSALATESVVTTPSLVIGVTVAVDISPTLIPRVLDEAADIWRAAGLVIVWQLENGVAVRPPALRVWIGGARGTKSSESLALGWIMFDDAGAPARDIYVSHANAEALLRTMRDLSATDRMPRAEQEALLGRAMGRALAHELGHFLLASKAHTSKGLMRARRTSSEFFSRERIRFDLDPEQRAMVMSRYSPGGLLTASAAPPSSTGPPGPLAGWTVEDPTHSRKFERD
jgi:hypothetical protein